MANWQKRFDRLLKAMSQGGPHKAGERAAKLQPIQDMAPQPAELDDAEARQVDTKS